MGEAALAIDPLSSQGVQTAIAQALAGACVVHTILARGGAALALSFYAGQAPRSLRPAPRAGRFTIRRATHDHPHPVLGRPRPPPHGRDLRGRAEGWAIAAPGATRRTLRADRAPSPHAGPSATSSCWSAVAHPLLARRVSFLSGIPLAPLLEDVRQPSTLRQLLRRWSVRLAPAAASAVLHWLWRHRVIEEDLPAPTSRP